MRRRSLPALALAAVAAISLAAPAAAAQDGQAFTPDLTLGQQSGVTVQNGVVQLAPTAPATPLDPPAGRHARPRTGLLTLPPRTLDAPAGAINTDVTAEQPPGTATAVDVRGRRPDGAWSEWVPAEAGHPATLSEASWQIQLRLVLTGTLTAGPTVRGLRITPTPVDRIWLAAKPLTPTGAKVFATREGLVGQTTANGHVITENDMFVALPSRRALSPRDTQDYTVKVCAPTGKCAWAPVWDVGPWNTHDDYWNPPTVRETSAELPQGTPEAQAAFKDGFNGGLDQSGRKVLNPAGIDLADGMFRDALGLKDNAYVTVDYLWTGRALLRQVAIDRPLIEVRAEPRADATVIGWAANQAGVGVECAATGWLRIGPEQFLLGTAVPSAAATPPCT